MRTRAKISAWRGFWRVKKGNAHEKIADVCFKNADSPRFCRFGSKKCGLARKSVSDVGSGEFKVATRTKIADVCVKNADSTRCCRFGS